MAWKLKADRTVPLLIFWGVMHAPSLSRMASSLPTSSLCRLNIFFLFETRLRTVVLFPFFPRRSIFPSPLFACAKLPPSLMREGFLFKPEENSESLGTRSFLFPPPPTEAFSGLSSSLQGRLSSFQISVPFIPFFLEHGSKCPNSFAFLLMAAPSFSFPSLFRHGVSPLFFLPEILPPHFLFKVRTSQREPLKVLPTCFFFSGKRVFFTHSLVSNMFFILPSFTRPRSVRPPSSSLQVLRFFQRDKEARCFFFPLRRPCPPFPLPSFDDGPLFLFLWCQFKRFPSADAVVQ